MCSVLTLLDLSAEFDIDSPFSYEKKISPKCLAIILFYFLFLLLNSSPFQICLHFSLNLCSFSPYPRTPAVVLSGHSVVLTPSLSPMFPLAIPFPRWLWLSSLFTRLLHWYPHPCPISMATVPQSQLSPDHLHLPTALSKAHHLSTVGELSQLF